MFDFQVPKITMEEVSEDGKYGKFVVEPLERGYGLTLGNSLRRIMLSSLPGAAVSLVKFDGVLHEFSTIPGVKEDVTDIIMNIKSLHIKNESESDAPIVGYIDVKGDGVVTAEDIQVPPEVEIVNKDAVIEYIVSKYCENPITELEFKNKYNALLSEADLAYDADYVINWDKFTVDIEDKDYLYYTYTMYVSININYLNNLLKDLFNIKRFEDTKN